MRIYFLLETIEIIKLEIYFQRAQCSYVYFIKSMMQLAIIFYGSSIKTVLPKKYVDIMYNERNTLITPMVVIYDWRARGSIFIFMNAKQ